MKALKNLLFSRQPYNVERFISPAVGEQAAGNSASRRRATWCRWKAPSWPGTPSVLGRQHRAGFRVPPLVLRAHNVEVPSGRCWPGASRQPLKRLTCAPWRPAWKPFERRHLRQFDAVAGHHRGRRRPPAGPALPRAGGVYPRRRASWAASGPTPASEPSRAPLFMIGSLNWLPNPGRLEWLLREVWPHGSCRNARRGAARCRHAARPPTCWLRAATTCLCTASWTRLGVHAAVRADAGAAAEQAAACASRSSKGMALGKAMLSTRLGAEGIAVRDGSRHAAARLALPSGLTPCAPGAAAKCRRSESAGRPAPPPACTTTGRVVQRFVALYERLLRPAPAGTPAHSPPV
ncbi:MAG: hypothetical protein WKG07_06635 [Hymenobacter sp.]